MVDQVEPVSEDSGGVTAFHRATNSSALDDDEFKQEKITQQLDNNKTTTTSLS